MEGPGRNSLASLAIAPVASWERLEAPQTLTPSQAQLWNQVVASKPSEWFKADCAPILEAYCKAITHYRDLVAKLDTAPADLAEHLKLLEATGKQARLMGELASKLRLTPQARYTPGSAATANKKAGAVARPWSA